MPADDDGEGVLGDPEGEDVHGLGLGLGLGLEVGKSGDRNLDLETLSRGSSG